MLRTCRRKEIAAECIVVKRGATARHAAQAIVEHELPKETAYFKARHEAEEQAASRANSEGEDADRV
jgi:hypothetical protein